MITEQVLADLWTRKAPEIKRAALRALRDNDAAEDVTARSFLRLAERLTAGYAAENVEGLLVRIAERLTIDEQRSAYTRPVPSGLAPVEPGTNGFLNESLANFHDEFDAALRALPDEQRDAFILIHLRGLTVREAATTLDASRSSVFDHSEAAITFFREELF